MLSLLIQTILVALLTSIVNGIIGSFVVARRMVFIGGGITHASFGGLGIGLFFGWNPLLSAGLFALGSGMTVEYLSQKGKIREDSAIAAIWSLGMAIGILFSYLSPGYTPDLSSYLFGNLLLVSKVDLLALLIYLLILVPLLLYFYRTLLYVSFDQEYASTRARGTKTVAYLMMLFLSVGIVLSIRTMGIMMLMSMLTIPQIISNLFTNKLSKMIIGSTLLSLLACCLGVLGSYYANLPSGACIIVVVCLMYGLALLYKKLFR